MAPPLPRTSLKSGRAATVRAAASSTGPATSATTSGSGILPSSQASITLRATGAALDAPYPPPSIATEIAIVGASAGA